jgi:hypothetical protein
MTVSRICSSSYGNSICGIMIQITINLINYNLDIRVTTLETTPAPVFTLPSFAI